MKTKDVVLIGVVLLLILGVYVALEPSMARGPVMVPQGIGGGGGGGWGDPSLSGMILFSPMRLRPAVYTLDPEGGGGGLWDFIWTYIVARAIDPIVDCIQQGSCNQADGPVGGGGGGGWGGDGPTNYPNDARKSMVAPSSSWSWFTLDFLKKKE